MYIRIIKKDLKRQKAMNIILLLFIILASTFISSSANNLISINTALKSYFDKAGLYDYIIVTLDNEENDTALVDFLNGNEQVKTWVSDDDLFITRDNIMTFNNREFSIGSSGMLSSIDIKQQKFFDSKNNEITMIDDGEIYMPKYLLEDNGLKPGDLFTIVNNDLSIDFIIKDSCKDAFLGSYMMGISRFIVSDNDFNKIKESFDLDIRGKLYSVNLYDSKAFKQDFNNESINVVVTCDQKMISITYVMDMLIAVLLLVVSVCLITISFVILRFTIMFTLQEEFREIGVMKAIGIRNRRIRGLYIIKYLAISIVGSLTGFFISIPFGNLFLDQVSQNIIISNFASGKLINIICSVAIIGVIILFCYNCTYHVSRFSPVRAIRNGSEGESFKRKGFIRLGQINIPTVLYLALNNIISAPKRFGALIITFTIGIILVIVPINTINTLNDESLISMFDMARSDIYMLNDSVQNQFLMSDSRDKMKNYLKDMEVILKENGINASVFCELMFRFRIRYEENIFNSKAMQGTGISTDSYSYTSGQAPRYHNEVALTHITADEIEAAIGDTVNIKIGNSEQDYMVTALYQSMNNMGEGIRFFEDAELNYYYANGVFPIQIRYLDNPSDKEVQRRYDEIKRLYPDFQVQNGKEYIDNFMGDITTKLEGTKQLIVGVIMLINILVAILMVKTFITKEKSEIGMLKSIGFRNSDLVKWQVLRIGIILSISMVLGAMIANPISQISTGKGFEMMGASHIKFVIKPWEVYVFYPLLILVLTLVASTVSALQIRKVSTQETHNIE